MENIGSFETLETLLGTRFKKGPGITLASLTGYYWSLLGPDLKGLGITLDSLGGNSWSL